MKKKKQSFQVFTIYLNFDSKHVFEELLSEKHILIDILIGDPMELKSHFRLTYSMILGMVNKKFRSDFITFHNS